MKLLQILIELSLLLSIVFEVIWTIQLNASVRVPSKMLFLLFGMVILVVLVVVFEFAETKKNLHKKKEQKQKFEDDIKALNEIIKEKDDLIQEKEQLLTQLNKNETEKSKE